MVDKVLTGKESIATIMRMASARGISPAEAGTYLRDVVEGYFSEIEGYLRIPSKDQALTKIRETYNGIYLLRTKLYRDKTISSDIPAILQVCVKELKVLEDEVGEQLIPNLSKASLEAIGSRLIRKLKAIHKKISSVQALLLPEERIRRS